MLYSAASIWAQCALVLHFYRRPQLVPWSDHRLAALKSEKQEKEDVAMSSCFMYACGTMLNPCISNVSSHAHLTAD